jgi:hypothetical protein
MKKAVKWVGQQLVGYDMYSLDADGAWKHQAYDGAARHEDTAKAISRMYDEYSKNRYTVWIGDTRIDPQSKNNIEFIVSLLKQSAHPRQPR